MTLKVGNIVSHAGALEWGAGKVMEVTASLAMIQFSDGKNRKIAVSHFSTLSPAAPSSFVPLQESLAEVKVKVPRAPKVAKAAKVAKVAKAKI